MEKEIPKQEELLTITKINFSGKYLEFWFEEKKGTGYIHTDATE